MLIKQLNKSNLLKNNLFMQIKQNKNWSKVKKLKSTEKIKLFINKQILDL